MEIKDKVILITGGASGMGAATARLLSTAGATVVLLDVNLAAAEQLASTIHGYAFYCDVSNPATVEKALLASQEHVGIARICINCAGIVHSRRMVNRDGAMPLEEFRHILDVNLIGTFNVMRLAAHAMMSLPLDEANEERGVIINTASIAAMDGQIGQTAYSASKGGIIGMTLPAARELAGSAIRVMTIAPGLIDTPLFDKLTPEAKTALTASVPFPKRLGKPDEYASLAKHIIENPLLNGDVIRLDGALRMAPK